MTALDAWLAAREAEAAAALRAAISPVGLVHRREAIGQTVRPVRGAVLASVLRDGWNPDPDYFYCWRRDGAVAMARIPALAAVAQPREAARWRADFADCVDFWLMATDPERPPLTRNPLADAAPADGRRFLRPDHELGALVGAARMGEPRVGVDGGPDLERWSRPQFDGPALCARVLLDARATPGFASAAVDALLARDLAFTEATAGRPCIGPWEEEPARLDVFTLIVQHDALRRAGATASAARIATTLEPAWDGTCWRAFVGAGPDDVDAAVVLAILWADAADGPFAIDSARTTATLEALEARFMALYPVNAGRDAPLCGRFPADVFFGGNPWLPTTLGFAELRYRRAALGKGDAEADRADAMMERLRELLPDGGFPEQLHRETGAPISCKALTWSAAALLSVAAARRAAGR
ncbi:MAG: glycoside hydrolase family 15 protein [Rubrimonas sp.]